MQSSAWTSSGMAHAACIRSTGASALTPTTGSAAPDPPSCLLSSRAMHVSCGSLTRHGAETIRAAVTPAHHRLACRSVNPGLSGGVQRLAPAHHNGEHKSMTAQLAGTSAVL